MDYILDAVRHSGGAGADGRRFPGDCRGAGRAAHCRRLRHGSMSEKRAVVGELSAFEKNKRGVQRRGGIGPGGRLCDQSVFGAAQAGQPGADVGDCAAHGRCVCCVFRAARGIARGL